MNLASSVAVPVAPGTPGIGNVTTGFPPSHTTDVLPAVMTSAGTGGAGPAGIGNFTTGFPPSHTTDVLPAVMTSAGTWVAGLTEKSGGSWIPARADLSAPRGPAHRGSMGARGGA